MGGKFTIIAHITCNNTRDSIELARHVQALGVDAIAIIPPIHFRLPEEASPITGMTSQTLPQTPTLSFAIFSNWSVWHSPWALSGAA